MRIACIALFALFATPAQAKLRVVTTLPDFASIASELGGDRVETHALLKGTQDPHYADAKPSMILKVNRAHLLIVIGLGLEVGWLPVLMTQARNSAIQVGAPGYLDGSQHISPKEIPARVDRAMGDVHSGGNPHYYTSPEELFRVARAIHHKLIELDPDGKKTYDSRWEAFSKRYQTRSAQWHRRISPLKGTRVVVYHRSWVYLIDWLGFKRVGALEPKPGLSPSLAHVRRLLGRGGSGPGKKDGVELVFQEVYHPTHLSRLFAQKAGARLVIVPSMVGAEPSIATIWDKFDRIVQLLTDAPS
jgi:zinc/manganese transport system substrate-binding protein